MKVDMSPQAVRQRLKTLEELWILSVKLMNSRKIKSAKSKDSDADKKIGSHSTNRDEAETK